MPDKDFVKEIAWVEACGHTGYESFLEKNDHIGWCMSRTECGYYEDNPPDRECYNAILSKYGVEDDGYFDKNLKENLEED